MVPLVVYWLGFGTFTAVPEFSPHGTEIPQAAQCKPGEKLRCQTLLVLSLDCDKRCSLVGLSKVYRVFFLTQSKCICGKDLKNFFLYKNDALVCNK